jgi:hypothetical protein
MTRHHVVRAAAFAAALLSASVVTLSSYAAPALADNCQPEELVVRMAQGGGSWESPVAADEYDPRCVGAAQVGCVNQADPVGCANGVASTTRDRTVGHGSGLGPNETLVAGGTLKSDDGRYSLVMGYDGNLVHYGPSGMLWESGTFGNVGARLVMQLDGNLVIYTTDNRPVWSTNTFAGRSTLVVQNDANLVIYGPNGPVWSRY